VKRLVLVGGGHAHVEVLRQIARQRIEHTEVVLVSAGRFAAYTGMVPGFLAGRYEESELRFDLAALAVAAGAEFIDSTVDEVDGKARMVRVGERHISFDACSLDVGSAAAGRNVPGVVLYALALRPLANAVVLRQRFRRMALAPEAAPHCVVVGGGAGGVEVALSLAEFAKGAVSVTLVQGDRELLPDYPASARRIVAAACLRAGVAVRTNRAVASVGADSVLLAGGEKLPSTLTVWLAGAAPPPLFQHSNLPLSKAGYFEVDETLRATDDTRVWGAGDCITLRDYPHVPKAGVYAVREGPVLARNLRGFCEGAASAHRYRPQSGFLSLLSISRDRALLSYHGIALEAKWAQRLKHRIDWKFMERYRIPTIS
jgi:pyridine nucleotide-disulfide oxidoreductase family protein